MFICHIYIKSNHNHKIIHVFPLKSQDIHGNNPAPKKTQSFWITGHQTASDASSDGTRPAFSKPGVRNTAAWRDSTTSAIFCR